jgi:hypothetical protein
MKSISNPDPGPIHQPHAAHQKRRGSMQNSVSANFLNCPHMFEFARISSMVSSDRSPADSVTTDRRTSRSSFWYSW